MFRRNALRRQTRPRILNLLTLEDRTVPAVLFTASTDGEPAQLKVTHASSGQHFLHDVYESTFTGGVTVAMGDLTGDGVADAVVAPKQGGGPRIRVFDGVTGLPLPNRFGNFFAYDPAFRGGVNVAVGDVTGDGRVDLITGAGPGGGPHVVVFDGVTGNAVQSYFVSSEANRDGIVPLFGPRGLTFKPPGGGIQPNSTKEPPPPEIGPNILGDRTWLDRNGDGLDSGADETLIVGIELFHHTSGAKLGGGDYQPDGKWKGETYGVPDTDPPYSVDVVIHNPAPNALAVIPGNGFTTWPADPNAVYRVEGPMWHDGYFPDNDLGFAPLNSVSVAAIDALASETSPDNATFRFTRTVATSAAKNHDLTLNFSAIGTAVPGMFDDYELFDAQGKNLTLQSGGFLQVTIPAGSLTTDVTLVPVDDTVAEITEWTLVSIEPGLYAVVNPISARVDIADNDAVATIGDWVWLDTDGDGIQDTNEHGMEGVYVELLNTSGSTVDVAQTDVNGNFGFAFGPGAMALGTYSLRFNNPDDLTYKYSPINATADNKDSDATVSGTNIGQVGPITVISGMNDSTIDVGYTEFDVISVESTDDYALESPSNTGTFVISRTGPNLSSPLTFTYGMEGTATFGDDYTIANGSTQLNSTGTLTFAANISQLTVILTAIFDSTAEDIEDVQFVIEIGIGYRIGSQSAPVNIVDDPANINQPVDIDTDIDRDGIVDDVKDEANEATNGTVVIADKEGVYQDADEPAKLRKVVVRNRVNTQQVWIKRSSNKVRLYDVANPAHNADDLFKIANADEIQINPGTYYLKGGTAESMNVCDQFLEVGAVQGTYTDKITITVLWVDLESKMATTDTLSPGDPKIPNDPKIFDGFMSEGTNTSTSQQDRDIRTSKYFLGTDALGVRRSKSVYKELLQSDGMSWKGTTGLAPVEFLGSIGPNDLAFTLKDRKLDHTNNNKFKKLGIYEAAYVPFGFVFRRIVSAKAYYQDWQTPSGTIRVRLPIVTNKPDDSQRFAQDISPTKNAAQTKLLISDYDAPGGNVIYNKAKYAFMHYRANFSTQHVVFHYTNSNFNPIPERSSKRITWSVSLDMGTNYNNELTFLLVNPNSGTQRNFVQTGLLPNLDLTLPVTTINSVALSRTNGNIKRLEDITLTTTGTNLIGEYYLEDVNNANSRSYAITTKVKEDHPDVDFPWSEVKESKSVFNVSFAKGTKVKLVINTVNGKVPFGEYDIVGELDP